MPAGLRAALVAVPASARLLTAVLPVLLFPALLSAQMDGGIPPQVTITPTESTFTGPTPTISVQFWDDTSLDTTTRVIKHNGVNVTGQFAHTAVTSGGVFGASSASSATITLAPGTNTIYAKICDQQPTSVPEVDRCTDATSTYTYVAGQPAVRVSPDGGEVTAAAGTSSAHVFRVVNPGTRSGTYQLRTHCRDAWTGQTAGNCTLSSSSVTVAAGDSVNVTVTLPGSAAGSTRVVWLSAEVSGVPGVADAGWKDVVSSGAAGSTQQAPGVQLVDLNSTGVIERGECVTVAVAPGAAYECGDLRMAHALPAHRTYNRTWAPVLLFNSQHAHPRPIVHADVTVPATAPVPQNIQVVVQMSGGVTHSATFAGSQFTPGVPRRLGVQWDGIGLATGLHAYTLQVTAHYGTASLSDTVSGTLAIVNRSNTMFGSGWWMAGWEHVMTVGSDKLWIGGDGSTRIYGYVAPGKWAASHPGAAADTLRLVSGLLTRELTGGGRIEYENGWHARTINRLGQVTRFVRNGTTGKLDSIIAPSPPATGTRGWALTYGPALTRARAFAPGAANRDVVIGRALDAQRITSITSPDGHGVSYTYSAGSSRMIASLNDRRGTNHVFSYDAAWKLSQARLWMAATATADDIIRSFQAGESRGVAWEGTAGTSVTAAHAYTLLDGPRTDVTDHTRIWLTDRGASRRIRDGVGSETVLTRGNTTYPALVTQVRSSSARGDSLVLRSVAGYDARGRVDSSTVVNPLGNGANVTTRYRYDDRWNRPDTIIPPVGAITVVKYDTLTGNPEWQEQGGSQRRVYYDYYTSGAATGQMARIRYPVPAPGQPAGRDSVVYDARGNLSQTVSPLGFVSVMKRDSLGRVVETFTPVHADSSHTVALVTATGMRTVHTYDVMDRDTLTVTYGRTVRVPSNSSLRRRLVAPAQTLTVRTTYDPGGLPLYVRRWSTPDSAGVGVLTASYWYDNAGRKLGEGDDVGSDDSYTYDPAGNVVQHFTKRLHTITMEYDALGRMVRRTTPSVNHGPKDIACGTMYNWPTCSFHFPNFPNAPNDFYTVRGDTARFWYDAAGQMVRAENTDAIVTRTYFPGGALATDSLRIRTWDRSRTETHRYGLAMSYDAAGRLSALEHPRNLTSNQAQADQFRYNPVTGAVDTVISRIGLRFDYERDYLGRVVRDSFPGGWNSYTYDLEGRRIGREGAYRETTTYDPRGKVTSVRINDGSYSYNHYSGLGHLVATEWVNIFNAAVQVEEFQLDALGHTVWTRSADGDDGGNHPEYAYVYEGGTSRVSRIYNQVLPRYSYVDTLDFARDTTYRTYDFAGNVEMGWKRSWRGSQVKVQTRSYWGADGRLRAQEEYHETNGTPYLLHERRGYFSEYRYDPLGRRVMVRTRRDGLCYKASSTIADCTGGITRYVWSGDNLLWEMRGPGADSTFPGALDDISASPAEFGVVGYTHAGGVDRPLVVWKGMGANTSVVVVPHMNWRGLFGRGTNSSGGATTVAIEWPGFQTTAYHSFGPSQETTTNWMGSLIEGQRDPGGGMYMRNRYYDPATGQFTQTDPIGIAGGLNTYGFAGADPVNFADPFGLCKEEAGEEAPDGDCPPEIVKSTVNTNGSTTTVTNEYAPLTQEQVEHVINEKRRQERIGDNLLATAVGVVAWRLGLRPGTSIAGTFGVSLLTSDSEWQYMPREGDQITTTVATTPYANTSYQSFVVRRADGNTLSLSGSPWTP